ncbi:hypothetical protein ACWCQN_19160 [Streptomyces sp. NPDC001984]
MTAATVTAATVTAATVTAAVAAMTAAVAAMAATVAAMAATVTATVAATVTATVTAAVAAVVLTVAAVVIGVFGRRGGARCTDRDATGDQHSGGRHREKAPGTLCSHERYLSFHRLSRLPEGGLGERMAAAAWSKKMRLGRRCHRVFI